MKKILISAVFIACLFSVKAQQLPLYSQYMMNGFLLNPAMAGSETYVPVRITARRQWEGITNAPQTYAISGHAPIGTLNMGIGGYIFSDHFGPVVRTGIQASYAYHLQLQKIDSKLALGISVSAYQYKIDQSSLRMVDPNDNAISGAVEAYFIPDANFGAYLYRHNYFAGIAATQLFQYNVDVTESSDNRMIRHYFVTGGYKFNINDNLDIEPSVLLKATEKTPFQVDINCKGYYKKNYWLGFSYRTANSAIVLLGIKISQFYLGYAFDYTFSDIKDYSYGSHEILLGVNFKEDDVKGSTLF